ncbi:MAG: peptidoglycan DD-metalloendopeptidase family protein [Oscillospiraceae bacterium]|jgi:murein DD-endopeptidase MepM/ murein hydrolase activator NlpD|nr:peptidoglycan DD-metalloendopeptidase family protein [Oscillospiraceae bacterium]
MNEKKTFAQKAAKFLAGRGFYIVLFACAAVIGVSAWSLVLTGREEGSGYYVDYSEIGAVNPAPTPDTAAFAPEKPTATPSATPNTNATQDAPPTAKPTELPTPVPTPSVLPIQPEPTAAPPKKTITDLLFARPVAGEISMQYSVDALVYSKTLGDWRTHAGVDFSAALGAKVQAACDGTVSEIREDDMFGTTVVIDHGFGLASIYSNLAAQPAVAVGDNVALGSVIGSVGKTALGETGEVTHLHYAMTLKGESVDPLKYLP